MTKGRRGPQPAAFLLDDDRERAYKEAVEAVKGINQHSSRETVDHVDALVDRLAAARLDTPQLLLLRAQLHSNCGNICGATDALSALISSTEISVSRLDGPSPFWTQERRRLASYHGMTASLFSRLANQYATESEDGSQAGSEEVSMLAEAAAAATENALRHFLRAAELEGDNGVWPYEAAMLYLREASALQCSGCDVTDKITVAVQHLQRAFSSFQDTPSATTNISSTDLIGGRKHSTARTRINRAAAGSVTAQQQLSNVASIKLADQLRHRCLLQLANCRLILGEPALALRALKQAQEFDDEPDVRFRKGQVLERMEDNRGALVEYQRGIEMDHNHSDCRLRGALCFLKLGRVQEATSLLEQSVLRDPRNPQLQFYYACACFLLDLVEVATRAVRACVDLESSPRSLFMLALCQARVGDYAAAELSYRDAVAAAASSPLEEGEGTPEYLSGAFLAVMQHLRGEYFPALSSYTGTLANPVFIKLLESCDHAAALLEERGRHRGSTDSHSTLTSMQNMSAQMASPNGQSAPGQLPQAVMSIEGRFDPLLLVMCGSLCCAHLNMPRNGLRICQSVNAHVEGIAHEGGLPPPSESATTRLYTAAMLVCCGDSRGAKAVLSRLSTEGHPGDFLLHHCKSVILRLLGDYNGSVEASRHSEEAVAQAGDPPHAAAAAAAAEDGSPQQPSESVCFSGEAMGADEAAIYLNRARSLFALEDYDGAIAAAERILKFLRKVDGDDGGSFIASLKMEAFYVIAQTRFLQGNYSAAFEQFEAARAVSPVLEDTGAFCYSIGVTQAALDKQVSAVEWLSKGIRAERDRNAGTQDSVELLGHLHHERAKLCQQLGNHAGAVADYSVVLRTWPENMNALVGRSIAYKEMGNFSAASADWKSAEEQDKTGILARLEMRDMYDCEHLLLSQPAEN